MRTKPKLSAKKFVPLIEIIIAITFFAVTATILVQLFAKAHNNSRFAHDLNNATLYISECIERIKTSDDYNTFLNELSLRGFEAGDDEGVYYIHLSDRFYHSTEDNAYSTVIFTYSIKDNEAGRLITGNFICTRNDGRELVSIDMATFLHKAINIES